MANFSSADLASVITFKVQTDVLENLRDNLIYADPALSMTGSFVPGFDTITYTKIADLDYTTQLTPLTEGVPPAARGLTISTSSFSVAQYGGIVEITDVAKAKDPLGIVPIASERISREANEVIDRVTRDVIYTGGTAVFHSDSNGTRGDIATADKIKASELQRLKTLAIKKNIRPKADGFYRMYISPDTEYDIKTDSTAPGGWLAVNQYQNADKIDRGEVGKAHGIKFIVVNKAPTFSSSQTVSASLLVGEHKGWATGDIQSLRVYHQAPGTGTDVLHQLEKIGWKVMFGAGVVGNEYYIRYEHYATPVV